MINISSIRRQRGFTLIELLVVVSIVLILVALLMPLIRKVRYQAQTLACSSNLRQIGFGLLSYASDNGGSYPYDHSGYPTNSGMVNYNGLYYRTKDKPWVIYSSGRYSYVPLLQPYFAAFSRKNLVGSEADLFVCPHVRADWKNKWGNTFPAPSTNDSVQSYSLFFNVAGSDIAKPMTRLGEGWRLANTSNTGTHGGKTCHILAADVLMRYIFGPQQLVNHPPLQGASAFLDRGNGQGQGFVTSYPTSANYLFDDGHVQTYNDVLYSKSNLYNGKMGALMVPIDALQ